MLGNSSSSCGLQFLSLSLCTKTEPASVMLQQQAFCSGFSAFPESLGNGKKKKKKKACSSPVKSSGLVEWFK
jgi:hypothetical protein